MWSSIGVRGGGLGAMVGGPLLSAAAILMASRPPGVPGGPNRAADELLLVTLLAVVLIAGGVAGLHIRQAGRAGAQGTRAFAIAAGGVVTALLGGVLGAIGLPIAWGVFVLGFYTACIGSTQLGIAALRTEVVPRPAALLLAVSSFVLMAFNTEDARALLAVPFGVAWAWLGYALLVARGVKPGPSTGGTSAPVQQA
jgi:hypothetical protein